MKPVIQTCFSVGKVAFLSFGLFLASMQVAFADDPANISLDDDVRAAITKLLDTTPIAKALAADAQGALVFPNITKAGFLIGIEYGTGALVKRKEGGGYYISKYYNIKAASYGLQAGVQNFGYAMLLMNDAAVEHVETSSGWDLGLGPSLVVVDAGVAKTLSVKTAKSDVYTFTFGQEGLMAGLGVQGTKISRVND